jgi:phasin
MARTSERFDIPGDMRALAENSIEQAQKAFDTFLGAASQAVTTMQDQAAAAQTSAREVGKTALGFAEQNIAASFEFAQQLVRARDVSEVLALHADYVKKQMQTLAGQARQLGEKASAAVEKH